MPRYLSAAETAKIVRKILKAQFPGIKFSVRSDTYSMGNSVYITWTDGPTSKQVDEAVGVLSGSGFDGMIDLKYNITHWLNPDGTFTIANSSGTYGSGGQHPPIHNPKPFPESEEVSFADHVSPSRNYSKEFLEVIIKEVSAKFAGEVPKIQGSAPHFSLCFRDYNQEKMYWIITTSSEIKNSKLICHDKQYGKFFSKQIDAIDSGGPACEAKNPQV